MNTALPPDETARHGDAGPASRRVTGLRLASAASVVLGALLVGVWQLTGRPFIDHDLYHQITLWRDALSLGHLPTRDLHSFLPTLDDCIHYEWGTGAVLYYVSTAIGAPGIALLRVSLLAAITAVCVAFARRSGAPWLVLAATTPMFFFTVGPSLSPVRAQLFTMLFLALQLVLHDADRRGSRWWPAVWLPLYVVWLNLHAGFVLGPILLGLHWLERVVRTRRIQWHLVATGLACIPLAFVNPYGAAYLPFVWQAVEMPRPIIPEWDPMFADPSRLAWFLLLVVMGLYGIRRRGLAAAHGVLILAALGLQALVHVRHVSIFAIAWACYVPGWLGGTPLSELIHRTWRRRPWLLGGSFAILGILLLPVARPSAWTVRLPVSPEDSRRVMMPVGAVAYLRETGFEGRLMTPFDGSSYVPWHLSPTVKIGIDSRYEAAYRPGVVDEVVACYRAEPGWRSVLEKYAPDRVLVPRTARLADEIASDADWRRIYRDDAYEIYASPEDGAAPVDRTGAPLDPSFP